MAEKGPIFDLLKTISSAKFILHASPPIFGGRGRVGILYWGLHRPYSVEGPAWSEIHFTPSEKRWGDGTQMVYGRL